MSPFFSLLRSVWRYKKYTLLGIFCHLMTAVLTVISIPLVIPFFQILFGVSPSRYQAPTSWMDLEGALNYGFSRLIAMTDHFMALKVVCILVVVVFFLKNLFRFLISFFMVFVRNALLRDLRSDIWERFSSLSLEERNKRRQGALLSLISNDLQAVDHGILMTFEMVFKLPLVLLGSLGIMLWLSPYLTLLAFLLITFTLFVVGRISHRLKSYGRQEQSLLSQINVLSDELLGALRIVGMNNAGSFFTRRFQRMNDQLFRVVTKTYRRRDLASPLAEFLGVVTIVLLLYFGSLHVLSGAMEAATFFAFIFAFYNVIDPAKSFSREYANIQKGIAALERIKEFENSINISSQSVNGDQIDRTFDELVFEDVSFQYPDSSSHVLQDISVQIKDKSITAITGISGSGKSTLIDLVLRFYEPTRGRIILNDRDVSRIEKKSYRQLFSLVTQEPVLFHGTVAENIHLSEEHDDKKIEDIAQLVGIDHSFLKKEIGDNNAMVSGGEAQRICLARALYRNPKVIILDEPTSQLDYQARQVILSQIKNLSNDYTFIIISHQPDLMKIADEIIYISKGSILDRGQYHDLSLRNDFFKNFI